MTPEDQLASETAHLRELLAASRAEAQALRAALTQALEEWEYAARYKGDYLEWKHGDAEDVAEMRKRHGIPEVEEQPGKS